MNYWYQSPLKEILKSIVSNLPATPSPHSGACNRYNLLMPVSVPV